jgi:hypothetical protein
MKKHPRRRRTLLVALLAFVVAASAFAFTASITFNGGTDAGSAGSGSGTISGFDVTQIRYTLDATNPANLSGVVFKLDKAASSVRAKVNGMAAYSTCTGGTAAGSDWTCALTGSVASATSLDVVAVS